MRFSKERSGNQPPKPPEPIPLWQLRIQQAHGHLMLEVERLREVAPGSQEEIELSWGVANRVGNFTRAILTAYGIGAGADWREPDAIGLSGDMPAFMPIEELGNGSRRFYNPIRNEVSVASVLRKDLFGRKVFNIGGRAIASPEEWGKDERIRGRVLSKMMGLLPDDVVSGLTDQNRGIKRR